jgi:hypothetical protein
MLISNSEYLSSYSPSKKDKFFHLGQTELADWLDLTELATSFQLKSTCFSLLFLPLWWVPNSGVFTKVFRRFCSVFSV